MGVSGMLGRVLDRIDAAITAIARRPDGSASQAVGVGLACAGVMLLVRAGLNWGYGEFPGFTILLPGVVIAALWAGRIAGITAVLFGLTGGWALVSLGGGDVDQALGRVSTINFVVVGLFVAVVAASARRAVGGLDASLRSLADLGGRIDESEIQLRAMVDQASAGIARVGPDGRVVSTNARFAEILGLTPEQMIGIGTSDVTHADDISKTREALDDSMQGREGLIEKRYIRPDGSSVWAQVSLKPLLGLEGRPMGHIAVAIDITAAKAAEAEVRESEARFRAIADTAPVLIWVTAQDRTRAFVNQAYVAFTGSTYEEARLTDWREVIHADDHARVIAESIAGEATGKPFAMEARYLRHDGEYRWLKSFSRPRLGAGDEVVGFVGVAFDVTEARKAEDDLRRINELLEERVSEAMAEKAKAEADLMHAQRMEAVGRLTGGVAHDFNNLLTVVIGALDMMLRSPDDAARRKKLGEAALAAARRGEGLTHQLLAFSRRQALRPEAIDLNAQIRQSEPLLTRAVGEAIEFKLKLKRGGARVKVDPAQFEAALLNLVVNARDAVGDRGRITVETRACSISADEITELPSGDYICVTVADDGAGMGSDIKDRVFEPFFTTKSVGKGTGLGLSQVYGFARQSGGGVRIRSEIGQGTEIQVFLPPLEAGAELDAQVEARQPEPRPSGRTLLLVEDDESVAAVAVELLRGLGLSVEVAESAPKALDMLQTSHFDLMLSDVVMPGGMTGIELARECDRLYPSMGVVLTSGYAGDDVDAALMGAPWPFLRKPYSGTQLSDILETVGSPRAIA